ncbi:MAG: hypothetical protein ACK56I_01935, partial [bacterium]
WRHSTVHTAPVNCGPLFAVMMAGCLTGGSGYAHHRRVRVRRTAVAEAHTTAGFGCLLVRRWLLQR